MKQDIASTEYEVIPAAVSSPGTKTLTKSGIVRFCKGFNILHDYTRATYCPEARTSCQEKAADVFPEAGIQ